MRVRWSLSPADPRKPLGPQANGRGELYDLGSLILGWISDIPHLAPKASCRWLASDLMSDLHHITISIMTCVQ